MIMLGKSFAGTGPATRDPVISKPAVRARASDSAPTLSPLLLSLLWLVACKHEASTERSSIADEKVSAPKSTTVEPVRTMHRVGAGVPDAAGWYEARSTNGRFRVRLPDRFNDFQIAAKTEDGRDAVTHNVGTVLPDGKRYVAFCIDSAKVTDASIGDFKKLTSSGLGDVVYQRDVEYQGHPGFEIKTRTKSVVTILRVLLIGPRMCQLGVEAPIGGTFPDETAAAFLNSFGNFVPSPGR